ncbi:MAG: N-acetylmuramoyl-L-alanine amidase [Bacteroidota bacterium]|nr:N-acetylmuramoyl-L-alanine amidase [Bacteroidota bacterium]
MFAFINYLIQVSILTIVFIALYHFLFRKQTQFRMNRFYLLSGLILPWIIPLVNIPITGSQQIPLPQIPNLLPAGTISINPDLSSEIASSQTSVSQISDLSNPFPWWILYWLGAAFVLLKSLWIIGRIIFLRYQNNSHREAAVRIISGTDFPAFSFFRWIFINEKQIKSSDKDLILAHEMAHSKQGHSFDLVLAEIIQIFLWFNPFIIFYKNAIKECHEFLADAAVLNSGVQLQIYAGSLQKELFSKRNQKLASYFRGSTLKKRMLMATRNNPKGSVWKYILILPLLAISLLTFSFVNDPIDSPFGDHKKDKFVVLIDPGHGGKDPGLTIENGWNEKDIVLAIARKLKIATDRNIKVILLRDKDIFMSMRERVKKIQEIEPDLFLSLHLDGSSNKLSNGWSIYYSPFYQWSNQSKQVAKWFTENFSIRGNPARTDPQQAPYKIIQETLCPAVLINLGFIDDYRDQEIFCSPKNQKQVSEDLASAIKTIKEKIENDLTPGNIDDYLAEIRRPNGFTPPIQLHKVTEVTNFFGDRKAHPILKTVYKKHTGIDLSAPLGTNIYPTDSGFVKDIKKNRSRSGYGTWILIEHYNNYESFYAHLDSCLVEIGDSVHYRQVIGKVGQTGRVTEPHLHFEIRKDGKPTSMVNRLASRYEKEK